MADELKLQLVTLTKNLNTLHEREAKYGGNAPLELLNRHLDQVLAYLESLKAELKQEAMALEMDQRLILV